jgi:hypothetical protein
MIYVADRDNHRVQRFPLDGSEVGMTMTGGNHLGSAANQVFNSTEIHLSKNDHFIVHL